MKLLKNYLAGETAVPTKYSNCLLHVPAPFEFGRDVQSVMVNELWGK